MQKCLTSFTSARFSFIATIIFLPLILTAHQPVYLPWLGLFHKIALADQFVSFNKVQYLPKDYNNRNLIKTNIGSQWLTVPVKKKGFLESTIFDLEIDNKSPWQRKHLKSIKLAYGKSPYLHTVIDFLEYVYSNEWTHLVTLNEYMLRFFLDYLAIDVDFFLASDYNFLGSKSDLVLDMCQQLNCTHYIFGSQGQNYANEESFSSNSIAITYQNYIHPVYPQFHGDFLPYLSILDLILNCGPDSFNIIMSGNIHHL